MHTKKITKLNNVNKLTFCNIKNTNDVKEKVIANDRKLIVPKRVPIDRPAVIEISEFNRLKEKAHVITLQDRMRLAEESTKEKSRLIAESKLRKENLLQSHNLKQTLDENGIEKIVESTKSDDVLLERSEELKMEQEQRVKEANAIILLTKCHAIRDIQMVEKQIIKNEIKTEDRRLDNMMEQQRQMKIDIENRKNENEHLKKLKYTTDIKQQIKENELGRVMERERIEQESRLLNRALIEMQREDERMKIEKRTIQLKMRDEFRKSNVEAQKLKNMKAEEQRISDMRIQEFMRQKAESEEALEKEKATIRSVKEKEIARLREMQQKSIDLQATLDELNAQRAQDEKERQWREKEKQTALKKQKIKEEMQQDRITQMEDKRKIRAIAIARNEEHFMRIATVQKELHQKELDKMESKKRETIKYCKDLLKQINEKERERLDSRTEYFESGKVQRREDSLKNKKIDDYLKRKIEKLEHNSNLPKQYIREIEKRLNLSKMNNGEK